MACSQKLIGQITVDKIKVLFMQTELAGEIITLTFGVAVFGMLRATYRVLTLLLRSIT